MYGSVDVNCPDAHNMTALHFAAMVRDSRDTVMYYKL